MATNVSRDSILDGIVSKVSALVPETGDPITTTRYVKKVGRIMGRLDTVSETGQRGIVGNCPAMLAGIDGTPRRVRTTIGRRVDRVETGFKVICVSDKQKSRDSRAVLLAMCEDVRRLVVARRLGLQIQPLMYAGEVTELDNDQMLAIAVKFTTKHWVDYTHEPVGMTEMKTVYGQIVWPEDDDGTPGALRGEVDVIFP